MKQSLPYNKICFNVFFPLLLICPIKYDRDTITLYIHHEYGKSSIHKNDLHRGFLAIIDISLSYCILINIYGILWLPAVCLISQDKGNFHGPV